MRKPDFSSFQDLLAGTEKIDLFDAVKPELQKFAENRYGVAMDRAYTKIFDDSYFACGGEGSAPEIENPKELVRKMGKGKYGRGANYQTARVNGERVYYYLLFSEDAGTRAYGERISSKLFGQNFYGEFARQLRALGVERPDYLPKPSLLTLGNITISFGDDRDLSPFLLYDGDPRCQLLDEERMPNAYAAMHWRARLSSLRGRDDEYTRVLNWALDDRHQIKVMLISGPGGVGKTRLAAEIAENLVLKRNWKGGFLPEAWEDGETKYDGNGDGVVFIIDYPEESLEAVKRVLKAALNPTPTKKKIRVILASRESLENWRHHLNNEILAGFSETSLAVSPRMSNEDAHEIASSIQECYPTLVDLPKREFSGVDDWLDIDPVHRLPLNIVAASVHAVLSPESAFKLESKNVLVALAKFERRRVRSYSERDLKDRDALEKLLSLSLLSRVGLEKETVIALGDAGIAQKLNGASLLRAVNLTPYWQKASESAPAHLTRLEPDKAAAAFLYIGLLDGGAEPHLKSWMKIVAESKDGQFIQSYGRVNFDLSQIDRRASLELESCSAEAFNDTNVVAKNIGSIFRPTDFLSANLSRKVAEKVQFNSEEEDVSYLSLFYASNQNFAAGDTEEAAKLALECINAIRSHPRRDGPELQKKLAIVLSNLGGMLSENPQTYKDAVEYSRESLEIYAKLLQNGESIVRPDLARAYSNLAICEAKIGNIEKAYDLNVSALAEKRLVAKSGATDTISELLSSLGNCCKFATSARQRRNSLRNFDEAHSICMHLLQVDRIRFLPQAAITMMQFGEMFRKRHMDELALEKFEEAIEMRRELINAGPSLFIDPFLRSVREAVGIQLSLGQIDEALKKLDLAASEFKRVETRHLTEPLVGLVTSCSEIVSRLLLDQRIPEAKVAAEIQADLLQGLATSPSTFGGQQIPTLFLNASSDFLDIGMVEEGLEFAGQAAVACEQLADSDNNTSFLLLALSLNNVSNALSKQRRDLEALGKIEEAERILKLDKMKADIASLERLPVILRNKFDRLSVLGRRQEALAALDEAVHFLKYLSSRDFNKYHSEYERTNAMKRKALADWKDQL